MADRRIREPSPHTLKAYRQDFGAQRSQATAGRSRQRDLPAHTAPGLRRFSSDSAPTIEEALPGAAQTWLPGAGGRYVSEIVVPLFRATPDAASAGAHCRCDDSGSSAAAAVTVRTKLWVEEVTARS